MQGNSIIFKTDVRLGFLLLPLLAVNDLVGQTRKYWGVCPSSSDVETEDSAVISENVEAESKIQMPEDAIIFTHNYIDGARWELLSLHNLLKLIHQNFTLVWRTSIAAKNIQKNSKLRKIIRTSVHFF